MTASRRAMLCGIYAIADPAFCADTEAFVDAVLRGGVRLVQYRSKSRTDRHVVRSLHRRTARAGALLIVNDDLDAAQDADGVHLGQEDLALLRGDDVRTRTSGQILGVSCGVPEEAHAAARLGADYLGVGPFAESSSKGDAGPAIGGEGIAAVVRAVPRLPVAAIGGIGLSHFAAVAATGARMVAILSALAAARDVERTARELVAAWADVGA